MANATALTPCCWNEDDVNALASHENLVSLIDEKENMQSHPYVGRTSWCSPLCHDKLQHEPRHWNVTQTKALNKGIHEAIVNTQEQDHF